MASASSEAVALGKINIDSLSKKLLPAFGGRGGGKPNFAQGTVAADTMADDLFNNAAELIKG
jgi:alanyl-tRNA synthetase